MHSFNCLSEREILALAISLEEEDARIYDDFAEGLKDSYPAQAALQENWRLKDNSLICKTMRLCPAAPPPSWRRVFSCVH
jgi:hypothetical protein